MAIFASIFAFIGRFVGRVVTMALGWATILLFGRVPQSKQLLLSFITLGSIAWAVTVVGTIFPNIGTLIIGFVPIPDQVAEQEVLGIGIKTWVRIAMLVAALIIPILVGIGGYFMLDKDERPVGTAALKQVLRGYPYSAVLFVSMLFMCVVAPMRKLRSIVKRWEDAHIPVVVKPGGYETVANDLERALDSAGLAIDRTRAPRILEAPSKLLGLVAGPGVKNLVPDRLIQLGNKELEVLIYPSDVSIVGKKEPLAHARAALASRLSFTAAYLTTSEESQRIEDRLEHIWLAVPAVKAAAQALSPAVAADRPGGGRVAAAEAVDDARNGTSGAATDAAEARETLRATGAAQGSTAADGERDASGPGEARRTDGSGALDPGAEEATPGTRDAESIAEETAAPRTREEILAAGLVPPPDAPDEDTGLHPDRIDDLVTELRDVDQQLAKLIIPHDEWEVLYRIRLQLERDLLTTRDVLVGDGHSRPLPQRLDAIITWSIGSAAGVVERALSGSPAGRVAGVVRQVLPDAGEAGRDRAARPPADTAEPDR